MVIIFFLIYLNIKSLYNKLLLIFLQKNFLRQKFLNNLNKILGIKL
jgi:hypothetical protein